MPRRRSADAAPGAAYPRIPFAEAISDDLLFAKGWRSLSMPQQAVLKIIYGQPLNSDELRIWNAFNGYGVYDSLGYLVDLSGSLPYVPTEYENITLIFGRRSSKTHLSGFVLAYEALLGGHKGKLANSAQDPVFMQVAQDLTTAKDNLRQVIRYWLESSPVGQAELDKRKGDAITAENIRLDSAQVRVGPSSIKLRGQAIACCAMDELVVWPKDREAANPDVEVENAVNPALMQFPFRKLVKTSTPWTEDGLLWTAAVMGTQGRLLPKDDPRRLGADRTLVLRAPTAALLNPGIPAAEMKAFLQREQAKDGDAFRREYLAEFAKSATGFLSPALLRTAVDTRVRSRAPEQGVYYHATMDPAFRRDAFAFCIGHLQGGKFVLDYLDVAQGTTDKPVPPTERMRDIARLCKAYGVSHVVSDQYADLPLQAIGAEMKLTVWPQVLTNKLKQEMWADVNTLLNQQRLRLLDDPFLLEELMGMERVLTSSGNVRIEGKRDDRATVVALTLHNAMQTGEISTKVEPPKPRTLMDEIDDDASRHGRPDNENSAWWS